MNPTASLLLRPILRSLSLHTRPSALFSTTATMSAAAADAPLAIDPEFPGTAVARLLAIQERVASLTASDLSSAWPEVRRRLLWAGGLRDLDESSGVRPGEGYTGHAFNDYNHCDLCAMIGDVQDESNTDGAVSQISRANQLGTGIRAASLPELGPGGSWSTCTNGAGQEPPADVAHVQFRARVAFKLVWSPVDDFASFALVDDAGGLLAVGTPQPPLPSKRERQANYMVVKGGRYAAAAEGLGKGGGGGGGAGKGAGSGAGGGGAGEAAM